jgi:multidrug resistance efflux pump
MPPWATVPPWLYQNDLPADQLQAFYVEVARKKLAALRADRVDLDEQIAQAEAFLADAEAALARYRRRLPGG